jgi:hypothetical protein
MEGTLQREVKDPLAGWLVAAGIARPMEGILCGPGGLARGPLALPTETRMDISRRRRARQGRLLEGSHRAAHGRLRMPDRVWAAGMARPMKGLLTVDPMDCIAIHEVFGIGQYLRQKKYLLAQIVAMQSISGAQPSGRTGPRGSPFARRAGLLRGGVRADLHAPDRGTHESRERVKSTRNVEEPCLSDFPSWSSCASWFNRLSETPGLHVTSSGPRRYDKVCVLFPWTPREQRPGHADGRCVAVGGGRVMMTVTCP